MGNFSRAPKTWMIFCTISWNNAIPSTRTSKFRNFYHPDRLQLTVVTKRVQKSFNRRSARFRLPQVAQGNGCLDAQAIDSPAKPLPIRRRHRPPFPTSKPVHQCGADAPSQIVEGNVKTGGRGACPPCDRTRLHRGGGLRHEHARRKDSEADDDGRERFDQGKEQSRHHHGVTDDRGVAKAEAVEEAA